MNRVKKGQFSQKVKNVGCVVGSLRVFGEYHFFPIYFCGGGGGGDLGTKLNFVPSSLGVILYVITNRQWVLIIVILNSPKIDIYSIYIL